MKQHLQIIITLSILLFASNCTIDPAPKNSSESFGFKSIPSSSSGLTFSNVLDEYKLKSPFNYINAFTGGGVAIGDINNDGLQDIYLAANMTSSKLFLNKGDMKFEDITTSSGTGTTGWASAVQWETSTTMAGSTFMFVDLIMMFQQIVQTSYLSTIKMEALRRWASNWGSMMRIILSRLLS